MSSMKTFWLVVDSVSSFDFKPYTKFPEFYKQTPMVCPIALYDLADSLLCKAQHCV